MEQSKAMHKFLNLPELIEKLILLLDPLSALCLLESHVIEKEILQKSLSCEAWNKLIRVSSYGGEGTLQAEDVKDLVKILKLMELKEPSTFLLPLLHLICETESGPSQRDFHEVHLICPGHPEPHSVTPETFLLLEEVEGAFGTTEQTIRSIWGNGNDSSWLLDMVPAFPEPFLLAISSRMSRQKEVVTLISFDGEIVIENEGSAQAFSTLLLQAQEVFLMLASLKVGRAVGEEGWKQLAGAFTGAGKGPGKGIRVIISKEAFAAARREDIIRVVEEFDELAVVNKEGHQLPVDKHDWDQTWARLKQISDMNEEEFTDECEQERRRRREKEALGAYTSDEDGYDEVQSEGEELQGEEQEDNGEEGGGDDD